MTLYAGIAVNERQVIAGFSKQSDEASREHDLTLYDVELRAERVAFTAGTTRVNPQ